MRLIDADSLHIEVDMFCRNVNSDRIHKTGFHAMIENMVTVDPVKHGKWLPNMIPTGVSAFGVDEMTREEESCSECGKSYWVGDEKNFCPNCGARMDGE